MSKQLLLPQGKREGRDKQLHHTHTYLLHQQDRQDQGTAGLEPRDELVLLYPATYNYFSHPYLAVAVTLSC